MPIDDFLIKPFSTDNYKGNSILRIVVLITDVTGLTGYSTTYGNEESHEMFLCHERIASKSILQYDGTIIKTVGGSILACFLDPKDALMAGIHIQKALFEHNRQRRETSDEIHVRIGIHFGDGVIEKNAIVGNALDLAARITLMAHEDEIYISQTAYDLVQNLPVYFERIVTHQESSVFRGLHIYKVGWDGNTDLESQTGVLIYFKPLFTLGPDHFQNLWTVLSRKAGQLYKNEFRNVRTYYDLSVAAVVQYTSSAIEISENQLSMLEESFGESRAFAPVPLQIFIDQELFIQESAISFDPADIDPLDFFPGNIYITSRAIRLLNDENAYETDPSLTVLSRQKEWRALISKKAPQPEKYFYFQGIPAACLKGPPCFYCSSGRHVALNCPSKRIEDPAHALKALMYFSCHDLNQLFFDYYLKGDSYFFNEGASGLPDADARTRLAFEGFYQVKHIFQLPFLKGIWDSPLKEWEEVKAIKPGGQKGGGPLWLAYDCLRIGNLEKAESLLGSDRTDFAEDYRYHVARAILHIERNEFDNASFFLNSALEKVSTKPQRIFILFLLFRLAFIQEELDAAGKYLGTIISTDGNCREAAYYNIVLKFRTGSGKKAANYLMKFVNDFPEYYLTVLIDPDLAPFGAEIQPELSKLFERTRARAHQVIPDVEREVRALEPLFGSQSQEPAEVHVILKKIYNLLKTHSYLGYLDAVDYADRIIQKIPVIVRRRKNWVHDRIEEICGRCNTISQRFPGMNQNRKGRRLLSRISEIKTRAELFVPLFNTGDIKNYHEAVSFLEECYPEISAIRSELARTNRNRLFFVFLISLLKSTALLQTMNLIAGFLLFPLIEDLFSFSGFTEIRQRSVLIVGATAGAIAGVAYSAFKVYPGVSKD